MQPLECYLVSVSSAEATRALQPAVVGEEFAVKAADQRLRINALPWQWLLPLHTPLAKVAIFPFWAPKPLWALGSQSCGTGSFKPA